MSKTGNSLLHAAFQILGLRSLPQSNLAMEAMARAVAEGQLMLHDINAYDCQAPQRPCEPSG
jgi:hypothetical protein